MWRTRKLREAEHELAVLRARLNQEVASAGLWQREAWRLYAKVECLQQDLCRERTLHQYWYSEAIKPREMIQADIQPVYGWTPEWGQWWWDTRFTRGRSE